MAHIQHPNLVHFIGAVLDDAVDSKEMYLLLFWNYWTWIYVLRTQKSG